MTKICKTRKSIFIEKLQYHLKRLIVFYLYAKKQQKKTVKRFKRYINFTWVHFKLLVIVLSLRNLYLCCFFVFDKLDPYGVIIPDSN